MRSRSTSPIPSYPQQPPKKYYTREEVSQILKAMMENKLAKIYEQLQEKQQMIRTLNQKLNRNDNFLQNSSKLMFQLSQRCQRSSEIHYEGTIEIINKMLNDKMQAHWHALQTKLDKIRVDTQDGINKYHINLQQKINRMMNQIRAKSEESVQNFKKKNNTYWIKIKEALTKMNNKAAQSQQKLSAIGLQISKYQSEREQNYRTLKELQNGQNTAKMLVELKKSVTNVYKNFEEVLKLQQTVKERYQRMGNDKLVCDKCLCISPESGNQRKNGTNVSWNKNKVNKQQDIVILEYSVEQDTLSNHQMQNNVPKQNNPYRATTTNANEYKMKSSVNSIGMAQGSPLSPITGKIIENSSMSNTLELFGDRYKQGHQTANTNYTTKNETHDWVDNDLYMNSHNDFNDNANNDQSNSFQFHNSSNNGLGTSSGNSRFIFNPNNAVSTSMLNFSLDCRKEMIESVRPRLVQMIQAKGMTKPIKVFLDQINYLKNEQGNYLFDLKGNMFKLTTNQFAELERDKIVFNVASQDQNKKSRKIK